MKSRTFSNIRSTYPLAQPIVLTLFGAALSLLSALLAPWLLPVVLLGMLVVGLPLYVGRSLQRRRHNQGAAKLATLTESQIALLAARAERVTFAARTVLFRQDARADCVYLLIRGEVELLQRDGDGIYAPIGLLGAGNWLGEAGLLGRTTRSVAAKATTEVEALVIDREVLASLLGNDPATNVAIVTLLPMALANDMPARIKLLGDALRRIQPQTALWLLGSPFVQFPSSTFRSHQMQSITSNPSNVTV